MSKEKKSEPKEIEPIVVVASQGKSAYDEIKSYEEMKRKAQAYDNLMSNGGEVDEAIKTIGNIPIKLEFRNCFLREAPDYRDAYDLIKQSFLAQQSKLEGLKEKILKIIEEWEEYCLDTPLHNAFVATNKIKELCK